MIIRRKELKRRITDWSMWLIDGWVPCVCKLCIFIFNSQRLQISACVERPRPRKLVSMHFDLCDHWYSVSIMNTCMLFVGVYVCSVWARFIAYSCFLLPAVWHTISSKELASKGSMKTLLWLEALMVEKEPMQTCLISTFWTSSATVEILMTLHHFLTDTHSHQNLSLGKNHYYLQLIHAWRLN